MPSPSENLQTALTNATARLAELDAVSLSERARMTYTDGNRTVGWNEYRAALVAQIRETQDLLKSVQAGAGPFQVNVPPGW